MKRMSEILAIELPTCPEDFLHAIVHETSLADDSAIAHAINHVDSLADALARMVEISGQIGGGPAGFYTAILDAKSALKAYRGTK